MELTFCEKTKQNVSAEEDWEEIGSSDGSTENLTDAGENAQSMDFTVVRIMHGNSFLCSASSFKTRVKCNHAFTFVLQEQSKFEVESQAALIQQGVVEKVRTSTLRQRKGRAPLPSIT